MNKFISKINLLQEILEEKDFKSNCRWSKYEAAHKMIERVCRALLAMNQPLGGFLLAYHYKQWGMSRIDKKLNTAPIASDLYSKWNRLLINKANKCGLEHYWVGIIYSKGIGVPVSMARAKDAFKRAFTRGVKIGWHEYVWINIISSESPKYWKTKEFLKHTSLAVKDSISSYKATTGISQFFEKEILTSVDLLEVRSLMRREMYSDIGKRHLNIILEKILKKQSGYYTSIDGPEVKYILGIIEEVSRANPTGKKSKEWFYESAYEGNIEAAREYFFKADAGEATKFINLLKSFSSPIYNQAKIIYDSRFDEVDFEE